LILRLSGDEILPFNHVEQSNKISEKFNIFKNNNTEVLDFRNYLNDEQKLIFDNSMNSLESTISNFNDESNNFHRYYQSVLLGRRTKQNFDYIVRYLNDKKMYVERSFLSSEGLSNRDWYLIFLLKGINIPSLHLGVI
jgi:hypothetical protein